MIILLVMILVVSILGILVIVGIDYRVASRGRRLIMGPDDSVTLEDPDDSAAPATYDCVIVPGALVYPNGTPSPMLQDRLETALAIYQAGLTDRILVSGDHGQADYDEVNVMRQYLLNRGVNPEHIFMDHAGFDTYDTLYRARDVFAVHKALIATQTFHLLRALYIGQELGLVVQGLASDLRPYPGMTRYRLREYGARLKAFVDCEITHAQPVYLGDVIPINGSGLATVD